DACAKTCQHRRRESPASGARRTCRSRRRNRDRPQRRAAGTPGTAGHTEATCARARIGSMENRGRLQRAAAAGRTRRLRGTQEVKRLLLDTEAISWWDANDAQLGGHTRAAIQKATEVSVSAASAWE